jgi:tripartite-type tricarboxylate transporter receptor subunit TctC
MIVLKLLSIALALACGAEAQTFPNKSIRLLVGYAPGGGADTLARLLALKLTDALDQQVIVDSRPGAGSTIGANILAKSAADGHTVYFRCGVCHGAGDLRPTSLRHDQ